MVSSPRARMAWKSRVLGVHMGVISLNWFLGVLAIEAWLAAFAVAFGAEAYHAWRHRKAVSFR